jgi:uncharacterized SAM-binding protein YcdF (DUF218 family)
MLSPPSRPSRRWRLARSVITLLLVVAVVVEMRLYVVPHSDPRGPSDAVVVLGGHTYDARLHSADALVRKYPGAVLVVSTPGARPCPAKPTGATQIICFRPDPSTTQGEAEEAAKLAKQYGWKSMTIVTTGDQIWRARLRFSRCWSGTLRMVRAPSSLSLRLETVPYETAATVKAEVLQRSC